MERELNTTVALLRRMINHHDSWIHRLPPEMLATVASHLEDNASLVAATHVCHLWHTTLLSSPRLWSHLDFIDEECALAFLERSKSAPLSVNLMDAFNPSKFVRESLNKIATRVTTLRAEHSTLLNEFLARPMPMLEVLEVTDSKEFPSDKPTHFPSLTSLTISGFDPLRYRAPLLTSFHLVCNSIFTDSQELTAGILLDFLRNCPLLETVFLRCDARPNSDEVVSLPLLRSFTHESYRSEYQPHLLDRLSLPSACRVVLAVDVTEHGSDPWISGLCVPSDSSYLSDIRTIKIAARSPNSDGDQRHIIFEIGFVNSIQRVISFNRVSYHSDTPSNFSYMGFSGILESVEIGSVETLCFDHYPASLRPNVTRVFIAQELPKFQNLKTLVLVECDIIPFLDATYSCPTVDTLVVYSMYQILSLDDNGPRVQEFAASRKKAGYPLKAITFVYPFAKPYPPELEKLMNCVGSVGVISGGDALGWDVDGYLLGATAHDNSNRS